MLYNTSPDTLFTPSAHIDPLGYGKVAIVTGCASGIGLATTQLLLAAQFRVCGLDARDFDYHLLRVEDHGRFHFHKGDLTLPKACDEGVGICVAAFGPRIDVLVNVAGLMDGFAGVDVVTDEVWERVMGVNLTAPVKMMRGVIPFMKRVGGGGARDGVIVNVASTAGVSGAVAGVAYTASKHGLIGATKNVAWRFRNEGIRCNAVLPGAVDSGIGNVIAGGVDETELEQVRPVHALQATPSDSVPITAMEVAKTIAFLVSDQARTINGVSLPVDRAWGVV